MAKKKDDEKKPAPKRRKSAYKLPEPKEEPAPVIDLDEVREAKDEKVAAALSEGRIGDALKDAVRNYVVTHIVPEGQEGGEVNVDVDGDFLKEHGVQLISSVFQQMVGSLVPEKLSMAFNLGKDAEAEEAGESDADGDDVKVAMNFDMVGFLNNLLKPAEKEETPEDEA
jgi:hypothetical protein